MKKNQESFQPPCDNCKSRCCQYTAIEIDRPSSKTDYDNIRWHLSHENVHVFVDHERNWHLEFRTPCKNLAGDNRCLIYDSRPRICREHGNEADECEYFDSPYYQFFSSSEEFEQYLRRRGIDWRFK
jgi:Fe-S-cluster containining protein